MSDSAAGLPRYIYNVLMLSQTLHNSDMQEIATGHVSCQPSHIQNDAGKSASAVMGPSKFDTLVVQSFCNMQAAPLLS